VLGLPGHRHGVAVVDVGLTMTLERAAEIPNRDGYRDHGRWIVHPRCNAVAATGLRAEIDEFTAIAVAEKFERLAAGRGDSVLARPLD
jgi:hypothetical protein